MVLQVYFSAYHFYAVHAAKLIAARWCLLLLCRDAACKGCEGKQHHRGARRAGAAHRQLGSDGRRICGATGWGLNHVVA